MLNVKDIEQRTSVLLPETEDTIFQIFAVNSNTRDVTRTKNVQFVLRSFEPYRTAAFVRLIKRTRKKKPILFAGMLQFWRQLHLILTPSYESIFCEVPR